MALFSLIKASKDFGIKPLFKNIDLYIQKGDRLGLIGRNGSGKSTLLKVIAGEEPLMDGQRVCSSSISIEYVHQESSLDSNKTILEQVIEGCGIKKDLFNRFNELTELMGEEPNNPIHLDNLSKLEEMMEETKAWNLDQQCKEVLSRLGVHGIDQKIKDLSGGYKKRVALASALLTEPDLLLLDEPTNHLDTNAVEWLQNWLDKFRGALVIVTHDRYFLDKITTRMIEIDRGITRQYIGNYSNYLKQKLEENKIEDTLFKKSKGILRRELKWLERGAKARSTKQKARIKRIESMKEGMIKEKINKLDISSISRRIGSVVVEIEEIDFGYRDNIKKLFSNFTYNFGKLDRIGIVGENGCGKSTLLEIISGKLLPTKGEVKIGETIHIGYFDQTNSELEKGSWKEKSAIEFIEAIASRVKVGEKDITASQLLEKFLFTPSQQHTPIKKLSGGEARRLILCRILMRAPNVLLLDEPTNDLDIETLIVLEDFLENFIGCVVVVSHDRYFLDRIIDKIFSIDESKINIFEGNFTEFTKNKRLKNKNQSKDNIKLNKIITARKSESIQERKITFKEIEELSLINKTLPRLESKKDSIEKELKTTTGDLTLLSRELAKVIQKIEAMEDRWLELSAINE